jgi:hypothetical protein
MDTLGSITFITPAGALVDNAINSVSANNIDQATKVLVSNGDEKKKKITITNAAGLILSSFMLLRFNTVTIIKNPTDKIFANNFTDNNAGFSSNATNITFQKVNTNHAD